MNNRGRGFLWLLFLMPIVYGAEVMEINIGESQPDLARLAAKPYLETLDSLGFLMEKTGYKTIYDLYQDGKTSPTTPMFISADLCFHTLHLLVDYTVRIMEAQELSPKLKRLTLGMFEHARKDVAEAAGDAGEAAGAAYVYFGVGARLLAEEVAIPGTMGRAVEEELRRIQAHSAIMELSFLPGTKEDYSQYVPRGHYTRSEELSRYFQAMMWFGRLPLKVPREQDQPLLGLKAALYVSMVLNQDEELESLWEEIYRPTAFFFGAAEDLTPGLLYEEAKEYFGQTPDFTLLSDDENLREFAGYLCENIQPRILSEEKVFTPGEGEIKVPLSMRFMPQRFVPDSYIFTELVADRVTYYQGSLTPRPFTWGMTQLGPMRVFPRGLDLMAVLRSNQALQILAEQGDTKYTNYSQQFEKMVRFYASLPPQEKESSIYYRWFDLFGAYKRAGNPKNADTLAWKRKQLITALASWTELRHDAILYAKQSYTGLAMAAPPQEEEERPQPLYLAVLEEAPRVYTGAAECARSIAGLAGEESEIGQVHLSFAETLEKLAGVAKKQSGGKKLSKEEHRFLWNLPGILSSLPPRLEDAVLSEADERMALVADVHTDPNTGKVLEEATGNPAALYVLTEIEGKPYIARGGAYTYYEFKQPMRERLTDKAWQEMLASGTNPPMPSWTEVLFVDE